MTGQEPRRPPRSRATKKQVEIQRGQDAIPAGAIRLSEAFNKVFHDLTFTRPKPDSVAAPMSERIKGNDLGDALNRVDKFFRYFLSEGTLVAYVRDPETGDTLQLNAAEWDNEDEVEPTFGFSDDYVYPENPVQPGPSGTDVREKLRPIFFKRDDFEGWFVRIFGSPPSYPGARPPQTQGLPFPVIPSRTSPSNDTSTSSKAQIPSESDKVPSRERAHRKEATKDAIRALYPNGTNGVPIRDLTDKVNAYLKEHKKNQVSEITVRRAYRDLARRN